MALWGKSDGIYSPGTVAVNYGNKTITGTGTSFRSAGITTGTVITIGAGGTFGQAVVSAITSETVISIASTQFLSGAAISGVAYTMSQKPIYTLHDSNYSATQVFGVDPYEAGATQGTRYAVTHAGWVGIKTYNDTNGNLRVKQETLVAFSGITTGTGTYSAAGDAADDAKLPDYLITFATQPSDRLGIATTANTTFTVSATSTPSATLTYQWQYASSVGAAYTNLSNSGIYSNVTTATVGIASTSTTADRPNGFYYRVVVTTDTTDGYATATSNAARLTYA
jgi:hypothetical protein